MSKQVALVTGGSRGIGFGIARQLAGQGFDLAINGMRPEAQVQEALDELRTLGAEVIYVPGDIGDGAARKQMIDSVRDQFGALNWLVNNAGVAPKQRLDLLDTTEDSFDFVVGTNLRGAFFLSQLAANWLVEQKQANAGFKGGIINVSSISATVVSINRGEYCIAKAGLSMATQLFATRLGEFDLPVYEVRPGVTKTDMTSGVTDKYDKLIEDGLCVTRRWGFPDDIGKAVGSLARGDFPYSTGQVIMVDGGLTIPRL
ncbi:3-ketoacyl-ACP reductase [Oceanipulchritudo coccoides]|nr:3-ketoacyl-ACP reductase [Oceanipulchritudo coccoides]